jgi:DNA-binding LytR/AlgR family response regulator
MTQTPRCLVAEDEPLLAASLVAELAAVWPELQVQAQVGDGLQAVAQSLALLPDVCFFDIRMPGCTGLEAAQALAEDWPDDAAFPLLVFVTAYDSYALQAFEAQAVDYLVKPVTRPRLLACVTRLKDRLKGRFDAQTAALPQTQPQTADSLQHTMAQLRSLLAANLARPAAAAVGAAGAPGQTEAPVPRLSVVQAQVGNLVHMVPVEEVLYFEAADKYVRVVTAQREHLIRASLKDLLPQLDPQVFWQVHRGTVVQARLVASARREESGKVTLALKGSADKLTASRLYAHLFKGM